LASEYGQNNVTVLAPSGTATSNSAGKTDGIDPFPDFGGDDTVTYQSYSTYSSMQATLQKRYSNGLSFNANYTFAHALDASSDPLNGGLAFRVINVLPFRYEYTNSGFDIRHHFNFNGFYELPFGRGKAHLNKHGLLTDIFGNWATDLVYYTETGTPFTVSTDNTEPASVTAHAILIGDPFAPGGSSNSTNTNTTCAPKTRNKTYWYNPCAFANPEAGTTANIQASSNVSNPLLPNGAVAGIQAALPFLGSRGHQIYGPGLERVNMSWFKNFVVWREQTLQLRADIFNVLNQPSLASPALTGITGTPGQITGPKGLQNDTPDARFVQFAARYSF
jgi:hypothetical protein